MTLARTRLLLGITAVGATVVAAAVALFLDVPSRFLSTDASLPLGGALQMALWGPSLWTLGMLPLDLLGGLVAVRHRPGVMDWVGAWVRGVLVQLGVLSLSGALLLSAARAGGTTGTILAVALGAGMVLGSLDRLARLGAALRLRPTSGPQRRLDASGLMEQATVVDTPDEAFVGGYGGVLRSRLLVPSSWFTLPEATTAALLARRRLAEGAPRRRGSLAAIGWVTAGAGVTCLSLAPPTSAAALVEFSLGMTLWSFLGVLVLPTPSRRAVYALDRRAAQELTPQALGEAITVLDRWQDDEPERSGWNERIFHPVPARTARLAALAVVDAPPNGGSFWRLARLALPSALPAWSLLGRAVHCNLGRPTLWWMLPGD
jgi:hypothetical protein